MTGNHLATAEALVEAKQKGYWTLKKDSMFFLTRHYHNDDLFKPTVVVKAGTVVYVNKVYRKGRAALLCYIDRTGKVWWSWTHSL